MLRTVTIIALIGVLPLSAGLLYPGQGCATGSAASIFQVVATPNENFDNGLQAAAASAPSDIWAVGQSTIHFNGTSWTAFPAPMIKGDNTGYLAGVVDISPTLAWAVGTVNVGLANPGQVIEQWNGNAWSVFTGPAFAKSDQPSLRGLAAISADDIWAVGSLLSGGGALLNFLFEHWDGQAWTPSTILSGDAFLLGVSADAANDIWAVGFSGAENDNSQTLVMHGDGATWRTVPSPSVGAGANQLNGVAALAPDDVWAVGFTTSEPPPQQVATKNLIEHWNGTSWQIVRSPNVGPNSIYQSNRLLGVTAISSTDVWAFGSYFAADGSGHQMTLVLHWDGIKWSRVASPNPSNGIFLSDLLYAGVSPSPGNLWIFGAEDEAPHEGTLAIHSSAAPN